MCPPPSSLTIESWDNGEFAEVLFPEGNTISINSASSSSSTYNLNWTNGNNNPRSMALTWIPDGTGSSGTLSGSDVTIYDSSSPGTGTELMTLSTVRVTISASGSSTGYLNPEPSIFSEPSIFFTPTNGVFTAQASPGGAPSGDGFCA